MTKLRAEGKAFRTLGLLLTLHAYSKTSENVGSAWLLGKTTLN